VVERCSDDLPYQAPSLSRSGAVSFRIRCTVIDRGFPGKAVRLEWLSAREANRVVIIHDSNAVEEIRESCDVDGSFLVLTKPIREQELAEAVLRVRAVVGKYT
jgi:hypothetical protein